MNKGKVEVKYVHLRDSDPRSLPLGNSPDLIENGYHFKVGKND